MWEKGYFSELDTLRPRQGNATFNGVSNLFSDPARLWYLQLSASLSQEDREPEDKERMLRGLDLQHQREREALDAQLDAEENELGRQSVTALDGDHTALLKDEHQKLKDEVKKKWNLKRNYKSKALK